MFNLKTISIQKRRQESSINFQIEEKIREDLAAVHRLAHRFGWDDNIFNHFSCALSEDQEFLSQEHLEFEV